VGDRLAGEVAIVTGATGLGTASEIARLFAAEGAHVLVAGRDAPRGRRVVDSITERGGSAVLALTDIADRESCARTAALAVERFGKLTVLVNSAVRHHPRAYGSVTEIEEEAWIETMRVSPQGTAYMCAAGIPAMVEAGHGSIVNLGSRTAERGVPGTAIRTASRGAVHALTRSIAIDFGRSGIRCNTVAPGHILGKEREMTAVEAEHAKAAREMCLTAPPTVRDIAYATLFLACSESAAITGITLEVDGGGSSARGLVLG
jgi:NAD(P)-dependent dehydrogenase (short-subunit alcohol dehydrogenase family)